MTEPGSKIERFARVTQAAGSISIIVGIVAAIFAIHNNLNSIKLSALAPVKELVKEDEEVRREIGAFRKKYSEEQLRKVIDGENAGVQQVYLSDEMSDLRSIGRHYEELGAMVRLKYVDFDLVYEIIDFPDAFWDETSYLRSQAQTKNWANGKSLPDFWKNFSYLRDRYCQKRAEEGHGCG